MNHFSMFFGIITFVFCFLRYLPFLRSETLSPSDPSLPVPQLPAQAPQDVPGLDLAKSLKVLGGKWNLLRKLLVGFNSDFGNSIEEIGSHIQKGQIDLAMSKLHTLKGVAGMLGAPRLHNAAERLEGELRGSGGITVCWPEFQSALEELLSGIANTIPQDEASS